MSMPIRHRESSLQANFLTHVKEHHNKYYIVPYDVSATSTGCRDVCDLLRKSCLPSPASNIQRRFVLHGLGSSGKTQVALKFAQDYRERYFCYIFIRNPSLTLSSFWGIFWIDCSSSQTIKESYLNIARTCRITEGVDFVKLWLTNSPEPWLLILDNADDPSLNILNCLPVESRGTVLITTRNPGVTGLETVGTHELAGMDVKDAVTLLLRISKVDDESQSDVTEITSSVARTLGCLALAIVQAGAFIRQKRCTIAEYGEMYAQQPRNLLSRMHSPSITDYKYTVYTTWELSVDMIQGMNDETSRHAMDLLQLFSFMHFASISEEIFKRAIANMRSIKMAESIIAH
jgi:hypothetical protein